MAERHLYTIETTFNARHSTGNNSNIHAHTFIVRLVLRNTRKDLRPFSEYENAIDEYLTKYRGHFLNVLDCFKDFEPTLENICYVLYRELKEFFDREGYYEVLRVEIGDNPTRTLSLGEKVYISTVNRFIGD